MNSYRPSNSCTILNNMSNSIEVCNGREGCTSEVFHACNCSDHIVFLCKECVLDHLSEEGCHLFISLEAARELDRDTAFNERFHTKLARYDFLHASIQKYIRRLDNYKEDLVKFRDEIMVMIEKKFKDKFDLLGDCKRNAVAQLDIIKKRMKTSITDRYEELISYEEKGLKWWLSDYIHSFDINGQEFKDNIDNMIKVSHNDIIYYTGGYASQLMTYDICKNQHGAIELNGYNFNCSSTCMLPNGDVMIVGTTSNKGDTYRFNTKSRKFTRLGTLKYPREHAGFICDGKYLYAFGGYDNAKVKRAERMHLEGNQWANLPDMNEARQCHGIVSVENRIYLIGGGTSSVEFYNILTNTFETVPDIQVPTGGIKSVMIDEKIYIINQSELIILSKEFNILETKPLTSSRAIESCNNQVIRNKKAYFYCARAGYISVFDAVNMTLT
jgi:hypothetical protein